MARSAPNCAKGSESSGLKRRRHMMDTLYNNVVGYSPDMVNYPYTGNNYVETAFQFMIFHGVGDPTLGDAYYKGDADLWMVMQEHASGIYFNTMIDYCDTDHSYSRRSSSSYGSWAVSDSDAYDWWFVINEYEIAFVVVQGGTCYALWFGQPLNGLSDTSKIGGRARLTAATSTMGDNIVLSLDRDLTGLVTTGQKVYLLNQTPDGTHGNPPEAAAATVVTASCEIVTVAGVGSGPDTLTVDGVNYQPYKKGSLVGLYPWCGLIANSDTSFPTYFNTHTNPNGTDGSASPGTTISGIWSTSDETWMDPDWANIYRMARIACRAANNTGVYGVPQLMFATTLGTQANGDRMLIDGDTSKAYWVFPAINGTAWNNGCLSIGPGATV